VVFGRSSKFCGLLVHQRRGDRAVGSGGFFVFRLLSLVSSSWLVLSMLEMQVSLQCIFSILQGFFSFLNFDKSLRICLCIHVPLHVCEWSIKRRKQNSINRVTKKHRQRTSKTPNAPTKSNTRRITRKTAFTNLQLS
jgi:hypothetical protein